jgi:hypothetical protein
MTRTPLPELTDAAAINHGVIGAAGRNRPPRIVRSSLRFSRPEPIAQDMRNGERVMAKNLYGASPGQKQAVVVRPRPKGRKRFRWWLIWLPTSILCLAWLASGIHVDHAWDDVMTALGVHNRERYSMLAVLGLACVAIVTVARILRSGSRKEE